MSTNQDPTSQQPAVADIVKPANTKRRISARCDRLRTAGRGLTWFGVAVWVVYLIMASTDPTSAFSIALTTLLPFIGASLVLGGIVFGAAASFVSDEPE